MFTEGSNLPSTKRVVEMTVSHVACGAQRKRGDGMPLAGGAFGKTGLAAAAQPSVYGAG